MARPTSGTINIPKVTGVIVITATARVPVQSTAYTLTMSGNRLLLDLNGEETTLSRSVSNESMTATVSE